MKKTIIKILATGFGLGYSPITPGTCGSLLGVLIFYLYVAFSLHENIGVNLFFLLVGTTVLIGASVFISGEAENIFGEKDCQKIVIDEVAGQMATYLFVAYLFQADVIVGFWLNLTLGFILFRVFDWIKIFPANWIQKKLPGGFGVVGDDVIAGIQAGIVIWVTNILL